MKITLELAKEMMSSGNDTLKAALVKAFPELGKSNFEKACEVLGIPAVIPEGLSSPMQALFQLEKIIKVANGGWVPDFKDSNQPKHYVWYDNETQVLVVFAYFSRTNVPATTLFKDEATARKIAEENNELFVQLFYTF